jgi:branched-chain amino acid transport system substrate-binding protein
MNKITRRTALAGLAAVPLARPGILRAQGTSQPVRIGLLSDMGGPYRDVGGPGMKVATELAVQDFGGSVLGRSIEILQGDDQNKPNVAGALARQWVDAGGVNVLSDGAATSAGLAIQQIALEKKVPYLITGPASTNFTQKQCTPYGFHFGYDTYALAKGTGGELTKAGGDTWFFITADYAFGQALERDTTNAVKKAGGKVVGGVRVPLNNQDFSSFLLQAQASKAKIIGLANAGGDTINSIKQAAEFGIVKGGQNLAGLLVFLSDIHGIGLEKAQGLILTETFYWDLNDKTRAWSKRFAALDNNKMPTMVQAGVYTSVLEYLAAVSAINSDDGKKVVDQMKKKPFEDPLFGKSYVREDGRNVHAAYLFQVKTPAESKGPYDYYKLLATIPADEAFRPLKDGGCPLVK